MQLLAESLIQELRARTEGHADFDWTALYLELLGYPPYPKQLLFHKCQADEILYGGAAGGGKTTTILLHMIGRCKQTPGFHCAIFRRTYPELEGEGSHIPVSQELLAPWVNKGLARYNVSTHKWTFWNGSTLSFCHCKDPKDITSYNSIQYAVIAIDEARDWTGHMCTYLLSRLRTNKKIRTQMIYATNPGGIGHGFLLRRFVKPPHETKPDGSPDMVGGVWVPLTLDEEEQRLGLTQLSKAFIQAKLTDNTVMMKNNPRYEMNLRQLQEPERSMLLDGRWDIYAGQALQEWCEDEHTCPSFPIPLHWERFRTMDWGYSRPYCVLFWALDLDSAYPFRMFCYKEFYGWGGADDRGTRETPLEVAAKVLAFEKEEEMRGVTVYPGPADRMIFSKGDDGGPSIAEQMLKLGICWIPADQSPNSRVQSKQMVHTRLKLTAPGERPGLVFFDTCVHSIRTLPTLPLNENNTEDVDTKAEDHPWDAVRYAVQHRSPLPTEPEKPKTFIQRDKERLSIFNDYTHFQPASQAMEGSLYGTDQPVSIYPRY